MSVTRRTKTCPIVLGLIILALLMAGRQKKAPSPAGKLKETGSKLLKLHGAHNVTKEKMERGVAFIQLMEQNLTGLRTGLKCKME